ncbi:hypothetical protein DGWBC_0281 [Dehalogenimonas sp. WBC-2]|nr:hypothetical protein DGWBC_0281 [Dehalogenimonas sp. WBC-2]
MLFIILIAIFLLNIVFGYWRANTKKFSLQWILAIHLPVPIAIILRLVFLSWNWAMVPVFVGVFAAGQFCGAYIRHHLLDRKLPLTSFLLADIVRITWNRGPELE